jgi:heme-degrading monooxygenase HmoA
MKGHVRIMLYVAEPTALPGAVASLYHQISQQLVGTPGLLGSELLQGVRQQGDFIVMSEWSDLTAFREWEQGGGHTGTTAPLRPYHQANNGHPVNNGYGQVFGIYQVVSEYSERG